MHLKMCCVGVQNEVAYEYFGDRFSVTAERTYKQVCRAIQTAFNLVTYEAADASELPAASCDHCPQTLPPSLALFTSES